MDRISVGIFDEHKIVLEGIRLLLQTAENLDVVLTSSDPIELMDLLKTTRVHVLLINIHQLNPQALNLISVIHKGSAGTGILILSSQNTEEVILKTIKAGAKGFLSGDSDTNELFQAIYSIRSGYDFYSKSITHIILNKYIENIKLENKDQRVDIKNLSSREIEILKLWGQNHSNKMIAEKLFISLRTVESHKNHIMQKLNLSTTVDLVKFAIRNNIIEI